MSTQDLPQDLQEQIEACKEHQRQRPDAPADPPHVASDQVILDTGTALGELKKGWAGNLVELGEKPKAGAVRRLDVVVTDL